MKNKEELLEELTKLIESQKYTQEELESVEWLEELFLMNKSQDFIIENYLTIITEYTYYMVKYELTEEFEMCELLKRGIRIVTNDTLRMLTVHYMPPQGVIEELNDVPTHLYERMKEEFNNI